VSVVIMSGGYWADIGPTIKLLVDQQRNLHTIGPIYMYW